MMKSRYSVEMRCTCFYLHKCIDTYRCICYTTYIDKYQCEVLERFEITQPTLSHHVKILVECGLVNARKDGKWQHYSLNCETLTQFKEFIEGLTCCGSNSEGGCCS